MRTRHEFETTEGDELDLTDMKNATWHVTETFVDIAEEDEGGLTTETLVFTHRVEVHRVDDMTVAAIEGGD
jgi:hypothetical protein